MHIRVAVGQIDLALGDRATNLATVQTIAAQAAASGAELLVLPELWGSGYDLERASELSDALGEGLFAETARLAARHKLAICGSLLERRPDGIYNTAATFDAAGTMRGVYRKTHLIGLMAEGRYLQPGAAAEVYPMDWGATASAICYDLRFPELFRRYTLAGARVVLLPAEWPDRRIEHWRTLLRARAIENQCVVVACNRVGSDRDNTFGGCSAIIDPWGKVLAEGDDQPALLTATLDLAEIDAVREFLPIARDRRPDVYGGLV